MKNVPFVTLKNPWNFTLHLGNFCLNLWQTRAVYSHKRGCNNLQLINKLGKCLGCGRMSSANTLNVTMCCFLFSETTMFEKSTQHDVAQRLFTLRSADTEGLYQVMLMQKIYNCYVEKGGTEDAGKVIDDFLCCVNKRFALKCVVLKEIAEELRDKQEFNKSVFFFEAYARLAIQQEADPQHRLSSMHIATLGLRRVFQASSKRGANIEFLRQHALAMMHHCVDEMKKVKGACEPNRSKSVAWCLSFLANCYIA